MQMPSHIHARHSVRSSSPGSQSQLSEAHFTELAHNKRGLYLGPGAAQLHVPGLPQGDSLCLLGPIPSSAPGTARRDERRHPIKNEDGRPREGFSAEGYSSESRFRVVRTSPLDSGKPRDMLPITLRGLIMNGAVQNEPRTWSEPPKPNRGIRKGGRNCLA